MGVQHITYRMTFGVQLISVSIDWVPLCLHLPQCSELTCCCLIILGYAKLFIKKNLFLTCMYYKENFMWNSIIVTTVRWIAINDLLLYFFFFRFWHSAVITIYRGIFPENPNTLTERKTIWPKKKYLILQWKHCPDIFQCWIHRLVCFGKVYLKVQCHIIRKW